MTLEELATLKARTATLYGESDRLWVRAREAECAAKLATKLAVEAHRVSCAGMKELGVTS